MGINFKTMFLQQHYRAFNQVLVLENSPGKDHFVESFILADGFYRFKDNRNYGIVEL